MLPRDCNSGGKIQSIPPGRKDCPLAQLLGSAKLPMVVVSCGGVMEQGSLEAAPPPPLPIEVELAGPEESQGEEKPERNPPSLHMDELPGVLVMLISLVWRAKGVEVGVGGSHCVW